MENNNRNLRIQPRRIVGNFVSRPQDTQIVARTTDNFMQINKDTRAVEDAKLLENLVGSTVRVGSELKQAHDDSEIQRGKQDFLEGKEFSPNEKFWGNKEAYSRGFHGLQDEARAIELRNKYLQILKDNNNFLDSPDPEAQAKSLYENLYKETYNDEYFAKRGNNQITAQGLARIEEAYLLGKAEVTSALANKRKMDLLNDSSVVINDVVEQLLNHEINDNNSDFLSGQIMSIYEDFTLQNGNVLSKGEFLSNILNHFQNKALDLVENNQGDKALKLTELTKRLRDKEGKLTERITSHDPKTGKLVYGYGDSISKLEQEVSEAINKKEQIESRRLKKEQEEREDYYYSAMVENGRSILTSKHTINSIKEDVRTGKLDPKVGNRLIEMAKSISQESAVIKTSPEAFHSAMQYIDSPNANYKEFLTLYKNILSQSDFEQLYLRLDNKLKDIDKVNTKEAKEEFRLNNKIADNVASAINAVNTNMTIIDLAAQERANKFKERLNIHLRDFAVKFNHSLPTTAEFNKIIQKSVSEAFTTFKDVKAEQRFSQNYPEYYNLEFFNNQAQNNKKAPPPITEATNKAVKYFEE